ncbi:hypothetical protein ACJRO7_014000 [Eucalyptus globulus]|uniref:Uncharacterized protein n=1 Tax=Eucalyptus globulus TaxID=34317 RepID=A0ABD3KZP0_EUCGL
MILNLGKPTLDLNAGRGIRWRARARSRGKAKEFIRAGDRRAAILCLKRKRLYEQPLEPLRSLQLRIHNQIIKLEGVKATTETADALTIGVAAMQEMQRATNIDDVDKTIDETNKLIANVKQIQDSLSTLIDAATDFDGDELEAELEELEGADPVPQRTAEEDELAASQAEMAL